MPKIFDRRSGRHLGYLNDEECAQLMALFEEPTRDEEPLPLDPELIERMAASGASERLLVLLRQIIEGREDFDVGWEPD